MDLRHLRYFVAVAEELHFGRAAKRLHIVQPALSKQIAALEQELGVLLLSRTKRMVKLTEAGEVFLRDARAILHATERATDNVRLTAQGRAGRLDIGFIEAAMWSVLPETLRLFAAEQPDVKLRLHQLPSPTQIAELNAGALDVGFVRMPLAHDGLEVTTVVIEGFLAAFPDDHRFADRASVRMSELADEPFIMVPATAEPGFYAAFLDLCRNAGVTPKIVEEGNSAAAIDGMVAAGLGISVSPSSASGCLASGICLVKIEDDPARLELASVINPLAASRSLSAFLDVVRRVANQRST